LWEFLQLFSSLIITLLHTNCKRIHVEAKRIFSEASALSAQYDNAAGHLPIILEKSAATQFVHNITTDEPFYAP
jgi:hypothetical protein